MARMQARVTTGSFTNCSIDIEAVVTCRNCASSRMCFKNSTAKVDISNISHDVRSDVRAQRIFRDQINTAIENPLKCVSNREQIVDRARRRDKAHQSINVAARCSISSRNRTENAKTNHSSGTKLLNYGCYDGFEHAKMLFCDD
jgi:hypothetical protein